MDRTRLASATLLGTLILFTWLESMLHADEQSQKLQDAEFKEP